MNLHMVWTKNPGHCKEEVWYFKVLKGAFILVISPRIHMCYKFHKRDECKTSQILASWESRWLPKEVWLHNIVYRNHILIDIRFRLATSGALSQVTSAHHHPQAKREGDLQSDEVAFKRQHHLERTFRKAIHTGYTLGCLLLSKLHYKISNYIKKFY